MPTGRPTDYDESFCERLIVHMASGLSFESFAGEIGVNRDTLYQWAKVHKEFSDAKKTGTERARSFWEKMGIAGAAGEIKNFNCTAWIFNMKNRFREEWSDRQEIEHKLPPPTIIHKLDGSKVIVGAFEPEKLEEGKENDDG